MTLKISGLKGQESDKLNTEWVLVVNEGDKPFNTEGCSITVAKGSSRPRVVTTLKAGLIIKAKETCRLVTGSSGKPSHGEPPQEEGIRNVHLYLKVPYLENTGQIVRLTNRQHEICRAVYDPQAPGGMKVSAPPAASAETAG